MGFLALLAFTFFALSSRKNPPKANVPPQPAMPPGKPPLGPPPTVPGLPGVPNEIPPPVPSAPPYASGTTDVPDLGGLLSVLAPPPSPLGNEMLGFGPAGATLPYGARVEKQVYGADAPLFAGERVVFDVGTSDGFLGKLEGVYSGPEDPSHGPANVLVDRVALRKEGSGKLPMGRYAIPASSTNLRHDRVSDVEWSVFDPTSVGLKPIAYAPLLPPGTLLTVVVLDRQLTKVIAIAQVVRVETDGTVKLHLVRPYRVIEDSGSGAVVFPKAPSQNTVSATLAQIVDPTSIPPVAPTATVGRWPVGVEQARAAQDQLVLRFANAPWMRGIGLMQNPGGDFYLKVNVDRLSPEVLRTVPASIDGVNVAVEAVGDIHALVGQRFALARPAFARPTFARIEPPPVDPRDVGSMSESDQAVFREAIRRYSTDRRNELLAKLCRDGKTLAAARLFGAGHELSLIDDPGWRMKLPTGYRRTAGDRYARYEWSVPPEDVVRLLAYGNLDQLRTWLFAHGQNQGGALVPADGVDAGWFEAVATTILALAHMLGQPSANEAVRIWADRICKTANTPASPYFNL